MTARQPLALTFLAAGLLVVASGCTRTPTDSSAEAGFARDMATHHAQAAEMAFIIRIMCQDTHLELKSAWRAIIAAPEPAKARALAALQDMSAVEYDRVGKDIKARLGSKDKVNEVRLAKELAENFRRNYARAEAIARGESPAQ